MDDSEQLQLWEKERNRFQASPGVLVEQFRSVEEFEEVGIGYLHDWYKNTNTNDRNNPFLFSF